MGPLDHLPIIEAIALHLEFQDMKSLLWVSRNCAKCFRFSGKIKRRIRDRKIKRIKLIHDQVNKEYLDRKKLRFRFRNLLLY